MLQYNLNKFKSFPFFLVLLTNLGSHDLVAQFDKGIQKFSNIVQLFFLANISMHQIAKSAVTDP